MDDNTSPMVHAHSLASNPTRVCQTINISSVDSATVLEPLASIRECLYNWYVNTSSGTGLGVQSSTTVWPYTIDSSSNDGSLTGLIVVADPKFVVSRSDASLAMACDVDQEFVLYLTETDETQNRYFQDNLQEDDWFGSLTAAEQSDLLQNVTFLRSQVKYSINGLAYNTLGPTAGLLTKLKSNVRWYVLSHSYGTQYTPQKSFTLHWYGNTVMDEFGNYVDTVTAKEAQVLSFDMTPTTEGLWDIAVLGREPMRSSMRASYRVINTDISRSQSPSSKSSSSTSSSAGTANNRKYGIGAKHVIERVALVSATVFASGAMLLGLAMYRSHIESRMLSFMGMTIIPDHNPNPYGCCLSPFDDLTSMSTHPTTALVTGNAMLPVLVHPTSVQQALAEDVIVKGCEIKTECDDAFGKGTGV